MFDLKSVVESLLAASGGGQQAGLAPWAIRLEAVAGSMQMVRSMRGTSRDQGLMSANTPMPQSRRGRRIDGGNSYATRIGDIAIVPVMGPLVSRFNWSYWSYDEIVNDLRMVGDMGDIKGVILDVDSPGGMVSNVDSVPEEIVRLRTKKPVVAHIGGLGASAAYWVSAAAESVVADKTALVGSVGALIRYVDMEGILTRLGANVVEAIATQSPNKRLSRDTPEGMAELQAIVDDGGEMFIESLIKNRGVSRETVLADYGQGLVFPASEALTRGLIDEISSFESTVAALAARVGTSSLFAGAASALSETQETQIMDLTKLKAEHPDLVAAIVQEATQNAEAGFAAKLKQAAEAERARIAAIDEQAAGLSGLDALVKEMKADGNVTPADAAVKILAAQKANLATMRTGLQQLDNAAAGVSSTLSGGSDAAATFSQNEEGWKAEWEATPKLQEEFPTAASYVATKKREARA